MKYDELEASIRQLVIDAPEDNLRTFGIETVTRLVRDDLLDPADPDELDDDAWAALTTARGSVLTANATDLRAQLERVDGGILTDGDMDPGLLAVITALEHWTTYLEEDSRDEIYELAIRSVEEVDFRVSADLNDFLAKPEMAAEYERIRRSLTAGR